MTLICRHSFKRLLLAVSGGLDSICLAHYFIKNRETFGIEWLGIAHVHHGLREGTADRDAKFVEEFAKSYDVPFFLRKLDGEALKSADGSLEENARDARYKALFEIVESIVTLEPTGDRVHKKNVMDPIASARLQDDEGRCPHLSATLNTSSGGHDSLHSSYPKAAENCGPIFHSSIAIVTAHHAGDQAETMFMRLKRGTTLAGLRGIQEVRILDEASPTQEDKSEEGRFPLGGGNDNEKEGCNLIPHTPYLYRPFLNVTRSELLAYAREHDLDWCEDESNTDVKFARNKIRHEFLPNLESECPGAIKQLCRIAGIADRAYAKVIGKCDEAFAPCLLDEKEMPGQAGHDTWRSRNRVRDDNAIRTIALDKKKLNKVLRAHADADLSELFRLWLSEKGFRFPTGFFYGPKEPAHVKIPIRTVYRKRSIVKIRNTVWICDFKDALSAAKFVSCEMKEKDYNEPT
ncbi:ATP-binding protein [Fibrobacter sp. UWB11]|uniref:tRNA lysidine(34) synthetase n=1 Tax=Fibrobacter sp. UWB11 TaxID=1896202 RepID=UPI000926EB59|nr:tRNA lysidine(34) synthetase [Fibrobacter sp. UWB11]SIO05683.1 tRNA(Ile)-lysidine synthase [Fibrobacter sp. UWB11]